MSPSRQTQNFCASGQSGSDSVGVARGQHGRDRRIDLARGLALICIFVDHIPGNPLSRLTLHHFGFSDASEAFVLLAGISAGLAYGSRPLWNASAPALLAIWRRAFQVYAAHLTLLSVIMLGSIAAIVAAPASPMMVSVPFRYFADDPSAAMWHALLLTLQPEFLDILPLYVVLLAVWLPLFLAMVRRVGIKPALAVSAALWILANAYSLNLPSQRDGGWFFNPFAWQLLFSFGVALGLATLKGAKRKRQTLFWLSSAYLALAVIAAAPWTMLPVAALKSWQFVDPSLVKGLSKTYLSPLRLLHVLALAYVAATLIPPAVTWLETAPVAWLTTLGHKSLPAFAMTTLLSHTASFVLLHRSSLPVMLIVNALGLLGMYLLARAARCKDGLRLHLNFAPVRISPSLGSGLAGQTLAAICVASFTTLIDSPASASEIRQHAVSSPATGRSYNYSVYVPGAAAGNNLQLIFLLHGAGGSDRTWIEHGQIKSLLDRLISERRMPPSVVVMPDGGDCWWIDAGTCEMEHVVTDIIRPHVLAHFPVSKSREDHAIAGISAGAFGALRFALGRPSHYAAIALLSPAIYADRPPEFSRARGSAAFSSKDGRFDEALWRRKNYPALLPTYQAQHTRLRVVMASGDQDQYGATLEAALLHGALLAIPDHPVQFRVTAGGHDWPYWRTALAAALPALFEGVSRKDATAPASEIMPRSGTATPVATAYGRF